MLKRFRDSFGDVRNHGPVPEGISAVRVARAPRRVSVSGPESKAEILCGFVGLGAAATVAPRPVPSSAFACCERGRVRLQQPPVISNVGAGGAEGWKPWLGPRRARGAAVQKIL